MRLLERGFATIERVFGKPRDREELVRNSPSFKSETGAETTTEIYATRSHAGRPGSLSRSARACSWRPLRSRTRAPARERARGSTPRSARAPRPAARGKPRLFHFGKVSFGDGCCCGKRRGGPLQRRARALSLSLSLSREELFSPPPQALTRSLLATRLPRGEVRGAKRLPRRLVRASTEPQRNLQRNLQRTPNGLSTGSRRRAAAFAARLARAGDAESAAASVYRGRDDREPTRLARLLWLLRTLFKVPKSKGQSPLRRVCVCACACVSLSLSRQSASSSSSGISTREISGYSRRRSARGPSGGPSSASDGSFQVALKFESGRDEWRGEDHRESSNDSQRCHWL